MTKHDDIEAMFLGGWSLKDCIREFLDVMEYSNRIEVSCLNSGDGEALVYNIYNLISKYKMKIESKKNNKLDKYL